jgi:hypothetical protein
MEPKPAVGPPSDRHRSTTPGRIALAAVIVAFAAGAVIFAWSLTATSEAPAARPAVASPAATTPGPAPDATPVAGSEVLPPQATDASAGLPPLDGDPSRPADPPLVSAPLPAPGSVQGGLVAGYPADLAGPRPGDEIIESAVTTEGTALQATLSARTADPPADVIAHYRAQWEARGLAPALDTGDEFAARSGTAALTVSASAGGTGTVYTVYAVLRTE